MFVLVSSAPLESPKGLVPHLFFPQMFSLLFLRVVPTILVAVAKILSFVAVLSQYVCLFLGIFLSPFICNASNLLIGASVSCTVCLSYWNLLLITASKISSCYFLLASVALQYLFSFNMVMLTWCMCFLLPSSHSLCSLVCFPEQWLPAFLSGLLPIKSLLLFRAHVQINTLILV